MDINAPIVNVEMMILDNNVGTKGFIIWNRKCTLTHDTVDCCQALLVHLSYPESVAVYFVYDVCLGSIDFCLCYRQLRDHDDPCLEDD